MSLRSLEEIALSELDSTLDRFTGDPTSNAVLDIGAVVEVLQAAPELASFARARSLIAVAAHRWLMSGLLAEMLVMKVALSYPVALLIELATAAPAHRPADLVPLATMVEGGLVGRGELPTLTLQLLSATFSRMGMSAPIVSGRAEDLRRIVDKRVLRTRTDEYDIATLMMAAQLLRARSSPAALLPEVFPRIMLTEALRRGHLNWIAILALLNGHVFPRAPGAMMLGARAQLQAAAGRAEMLPMPNRDVLYSEFLERSDLGLRLRSTLACYAFLNEDLHDPAL
jgi:hypothetical protein